MGSPDKICWHSKCLLPLLTISLYITLLVAYHGKLPRRPHVSSKSCILCINCLFGLEVSRILWSSSKLELKREYNIEFWSESEPSPSLTIYITPILSSVCLRNQLRSVHIGPGWVDYCSLGLAVESGGCAANTSASGTLCCEAVSGAELANNKNQFTLPYF